MTNLAIKNAPQLSTIDGTELLPTGGKGDFSVSLKKVSDFAVENAGKVFNPKIDLKADKLYVDDSLNLKADKLYVDDSLNLKADKTDIPTDEMIMAMEKEDRFVKTWSGRTQREKNYEIVSLLDFGANTNNALLSSIYDNLDQLKDKYPNIASKLTSLNFTVNDLALLLYVDSTSKGDTLYIPSGNFKFNISHELTNRFVRAEKNTYIDFTDCTDNIGFRFLGSISAASNVTSVAGRVISLSGVATYNVGDWLLLKSVTNSGDKAEAGEDWTLGMTTAGVSPVYFAEPVQVESVQGSEITVTRGLVFPKYNLTKSAKVATTAKLNFSEGGIFGFPTFKLPSKQFTAVSVQYVKDGLIEVNFDTSQSAGMGLVLSNCMATSVKGTAKRPSNWELNGVDHSQFNTWKSISGWFNTFDVVEYNGSQTLDQTYSGIPSLLEEFKVVSINPKEQGMTTHGFAYGTIINARVTNNITSAVSNRARFTTINMVAIGNGLNVNAQNIGLSLLDYGMTDVYCNVKLHNQNVGVKFDKSYNAVDSMPSVVTTEIVGSITHCDRAYRFDRLVMDDLSSSSCIQLKANSSMCNSIVYSNTGGWHCGDLQGNHILNPQTPYNYAFRVTRAFGWRVSNFKCTNYPENMTVFAHITGSNTTGLNILCIDYESCLFQGSGKITEDTMINSAPITNLNTAFLLNQNRLGVTSEMTFIGTIETSAVGAISASVQMPIGKEYMIVSKTLPISFVASNGVTIFGKTTPDMFVKIRRVGDNEYFIQ